MNIIRYTDASFSKRLRELAACSSLFDPVIEQRTRAIVDDVRERGDAALLELTERFDGAKLSAEQLPVTQAELVAASLKADDSLRAAVAEAEGNIAAFARKSRRKNWTTRNSHGATVGEKFDAFQRVGVYIPGGTAPLVSTALMTVTLANQLAPEHCEVMTRNAGQLSRGISTAGAIFLGSYSPTVLGDYVAGPSHTLPTGGAGASFAGLTIDQFQRRTSVVEYNRTSLRKALPAVRKFAELEGLSAHGKSAEIRKP